VHVGDDEVLRNDSLRYVLRCVAAGLPSSIRFSVALAARGGLAIIAIPVVPDTMRHHANVREVRFTFVGNFDRCRRN
jgi:hypothetical protein